MPNSVGLGIIVLVVLAASVVGVVRVLRFAHRIGRQKPPEDWTD